MLHARLGPTMRPNLRLTDPMGSTRAISNTHRIIYIILQPTPHYPRRQLIFRTPRKPRSLGPTSLNVTSKRHAADVSYSTPGVETGSSYKPPVSFDSTGHDISFQIPLKSISATDKVTSGNTKMLDFMYDDVISRHWNGNIQPKTEAGWEK